jgi:protein gp37
MAENSNIGWTDHTFNPVIGCTKVSPGCVYCYADEEDKKKFSKVLGGATKENPIRHWGKGAPRYRTSEENWKKPLKWNRHSWVCDTCGTPTGVIGQEWCYQCKDVRKFHRARVFCASMADWLDEEWPIEVLADLLKLIHDTPNLDWLLLTKRPENWRKRIIAVHDFIAAETNTANQCRLEWAQNLAYSWATCHDIPTTKHHSPPSNVWLGTSVENQEYADKRIPELLKIPARVRFLSMEPLLGPVELSDVTNRADAVSQLGKKSMDGIHWIIAGGESGPKRREMKLEWAESLRDQCKAAGVAFFFKQKSGLYPGNLDGVPQDLLVQEFPK